MKKLWFLLFALFAFLCFSGQAFGQAYPGTVLQNSSGNYSRAVPYPQVLVCVANDGNVPCVTRATTYSDSTLGTQCTQTGSSGLLIGNPTSGANCNNPGIGDVNGNFQLYLVNGQYTLCTFSGSWLCQQFTIGGSGGSGIGCGSSHSVVYSSALNSFACDPFFTDDGAGHPTAKSLGLTDSTYTGFFYQTAGGFPPLSAAHSVFVGAPGTVNTTYGINWPSALPSNGDCVSWTTSGSITQFTDAGSPCASGGSAASTYRTCTLIYGADNGGGLANLDLGPQGRQCILPYNATIIQVEVAADTGTPSVLLAVNHHGSDTNILSSALSTAASGGVACSTTGGGLGFDGVTTCSSTLQNTSALQGDYIEAVSGTASTAHRMSIFITFTQPNFTSGGTVTSVGLNVNGGSSSGLFSVSGSPILTAGTLNIATTGTAASMPYFSASNTLSDSAALTDGQLMIGSSTGNPAPATITAGSNITVTNGHNSITIASTGGGGGYVQLSQQTLSSPASSITFSGISGSYTSLRLLIQMNQTNASSAEDVAYQLNGDTGAHYDWNYTPGGGNTSGASAAHFCYVNQNAASFPPTQAVVEFVNYSLTTLWKTSSSICTNSGSTVGGTNNMFIYGGTWQSTSAITSIKLTVVSGDNFATGTTATLYGEQ